MQVDAVAGLAVHLVDDEDVADGDLLLAAASANDRVHVELTLFVNGARALCLDRLDSDRPRQHGRRTVGAPRDQTTGWAPPRSANRRSGPRSAATGWAGRRHDACARAPPAGGPAGRPLGRGVPRSRLGPAPARLLPRLGGPAPVSLPRPGSASLHRLRRAARARRPAPARRLAPTRSCRCPRPARRPRPAASLASSWLLRPGSMSSVRLVDRAASLASSAAAWAAAAIWAGVGPPCVRLAAARLGPAAWPARPTRAGGCAAGGRRRRLRAGAAAPRCRSAAALCRRRGLRCAAVVGGPCRPGRRGR